MKHLKTSIRLTAFILLLSMLMLSGCGAKVSYSEDTIMEELLAAQQVDTLLSNYDSILIKTNPDNDSIYSNTIAYLDNEVYYVSDDEGYVELLYHDYDYYTFGDGEEYLEPISDEIAEYFSNLISVESAMLEEVVELSQEDDVVLLTTKMNSEQLQELYGEDFSSYYEEGDYEVNQYILDAKTLLVLTSTTIAYDADGNVISQYSCTITPNAERPAEVTEQLDYVIPLIDVYENTENHTSEATE